jgi:hypothetical protein
MRRAAALHDTRFNHGGLAGFDRFLLGGLSLLLWSLSAFAAQPLLPNGNLELADPAVAGKPAFWDKPDGLGVQWTNATGHGKAIRMNTAISERDMVAAWKAAGITKFDIPKAAGNAIAETYGLSHYSDAIPVVKGQAYKVTFDFKGRGGGAKLWVRGYGDFQGEKRRRWETTVNCRHTAGDDWVTITQEFFPTKMRAEVTEMRVMLYAYHPPGEYWFDNIRIEPITVEEYDRLRSEGAKPAGPARKKAP